MFVFVMFFNRSQVLKFGAPSRYYKGALTQEIILSWSGLLSDLILMLTEKNQNKHLKFDNKFVIPRPVEMTWSAPWSNGPIEIIDNSPTMPTHLTPRARASLSPLPEIVFQKFLKNYIFLEKFKKNLPPPWIPFRNQTRRSLEIAQTAWLPTATIFSGARKKN